MVKVNVRYFIISVHFVLTSIGTQQKSKVVSSGPITVAFHGFKLDWRSTWDPTVAWGILHEV